VGGCGGRGDGGCVLSFFLSFPVMAWQMTFANSIPCFPRFRWIFAAKIWNRLEVEVSVPQIHGTDSKLFVRHVWGVKPIYHDGPVMELQHCLCFIEQHHIFDSHYHGQKKVKNGKTQRPGCAFHVKYRVQYLAVLRIKGVFS
jgi:hypothetical protein